MTTHKSDMFSENRPGLAIITNSITPYHVNLEKLVAGGIPELKLHVLISHWQTDFAWNVDIPPEVHLQRFGAVGEHSDESVFRRPLWDWKKGGRFIKLFQENDVRAAIFVGYQYCSYVRLMNYCYRHRIPFFVNADNNARSERNLSPLKGLAKRTIYAWWMKRVSGVMSMGRLGDQFFLKYGANPERMYRVPYWPDFQAFETVSGAELQRFRQKFGVNQDRHYLMYSGRLVPQKRVDLLIDAFAQIAEARPSWDLLIVGDGPLRRELQDRVPSRLRKRVIWTGFLEGSELALSFHASDILVLPSEVENWALVVQEAMTAGLAVVASDVVGAAYDLLSDGMGGRVFPVGKLDGLVNALLEVSDEQSLPILSRQAIDTITHWRSITNPVLEIRRALIDAKVIAPSLSESAILRSETLPDG